MAARPCAHPAAEVSLSRKEALQLVSRWTATRKAQVLRAVAAGVVTQAEIMDAHGIDAEEWANWSRGAEEFGLVGLRAKKAPMLLRGAQ